MSVAEAVEADLKLFSAEIAKSTLAATARVLAIRLDDDEAPAYAVAAASKELREVMGELRKQAPMKAKNDSVDDISAARAKRLGNTGS